MEIFIGLTFFKKSLHSPKKITYICTHISGSSSVGRAPAFQAGCREFEPRLPLKSLKRKFEAFFIALPEAV